MTADRAITTLDDLLATRRRCRVYIAGPYTQDHQGRTSPKIREENTEWAICVMSTLIDLGYAPLCPHLSHFVNTRFVHQWSDWMELDLAWVGVCEIVLRLPGPSKGADLEVEFARANNIPVVYSITELLTVAPIRPLPEQHAEAFAETLAKSTDRLMMTEDMQGDALMNGALQSLSKDTIDTEGRKDDAGKAPWHLLAFDAIAGIVEVLKFGATKYSPRNWEAGLAFSRVYAAALRHLIAWWEGEDLDPETGLHHLDHAMTDTMFLSAYVKRGHKHLDDRPEVVVDKTEQWH